MVADWWLKKKRGVGVEKGGGMCLLWGGEGGG